MAISWKKVMAGLVATLMLAGTSVVAEGAPEGGPQGGPEGGPGPGGPMMMEDVIDGTEIVELTQDMFSDEDDKFVFTNKNYTLTDSIVVGDGDSLEIHRGAVLTIKDGGSISVTGTGKLISNSQVFIKEGGTVTDEAAEVQGVFGEGYLRVMKNGSLTLGGVKFASPNAEEDGAWASVNGGWLSVQHRELETKNVNLMVAGTPDEWGDVFFYRMDPSILYDVEGEGVKDRNLALNISRNSSATIMGNVDLTDNVEVKINGTQPSLCICN